eukprot:CAMPEP_0172521388 /NCGR_PEP_ID=MMETSP1066-20121228/292554_1 /TAXON_ID=671091 /ORGANISM="Coscinodiscus wailesii, Strain CCMP2513" /LENGTH=471 /DNA_ID=CAMNT_0013304295 /DNA_START=145 /DNA_END=1560 /DNA_ORIENTATION=+
MNGLAPLNEPYNSNDFRKQRRIGEHYNVSSNNILRQKKSITNKPMMHQNSEDNNNDISSETENENKNNNCPISPSIMSVSSLSCNSPIPNENLTQNSINIQKNEIDNSNAPPSDTKPPQPAIQKDSLRKTSFSPCPPPPLAIDNTTTTKNNKNEFFPQTPKITIPPNPEKHCHPHTGFVHCLLLREKTTVTSHHPFSSRTRYILHFQKQNPSSPTTSVWRNNNNTTVMGMIAEKSHSSSYHIFDVTRGSPYSSGSGNNNTPRAMTMPHHYHHETTTQASSNNNNNNTTGGIKLNKKQGSYIGKLKKHATPHAKTGQYLLLRSSKDESAAYSFDIPPIASQWRDGQPPRKLRVVLPSTTTSSSSSSSADFPPSSSSEKNCAKWLESASGGVTKNLRLLETRDPSYEGGQYRLNFSGRVTVPSVKNMQVLDGGCGGELCLQFGRVGENRFHLDYRAPLNAFQAFGMALAQFDL